MTVLTFLALAVPHLAAHALASTPRLDGKLDDTAWLGIAPFADFVQKEPDSGAVPSEPTRLRIGHDDHDLWIAIDCDQASARPIARLTRRDRVIEDDRVMVDLDTRGDGKSAFHFEVSAAGVLVDGVRFDDTELSLDWDENWEAEVHRRAGGWSAEIRLPLRILRFRADTRTWGIQVRRRVAARREIDELAPIPRGEAGEVSRYGTLDAPTGVAAPGLLELRPFVVTRYGETSTTGWAAGLSAGGDTIVATWWSSVQHLRGGRYVEGEASVLAHATSALDLELIPTFLTARGEPRFVAVDAAGALVFGKQAADGLGVALRSTYAFSPRATLQVFVQGFHEHVCYRDYAAATPGDREIHLDELMPTAAPAIDTDERSLQLDGNVVVRWEYRLGAFLSLVYSRSQRSIPRPADPITWLKAPPDQVFLVKIAGWWGT